MKKTLLCWRIFAAVLLLTVSTISWANGTEINGIYYVLDSSTKTASVTYTGTYTGTTSSYNPSSTAYTGSITIPSTVTYNSTTYSVTSIGEIAFYGCSGLTSITIPNSVTSIGEIAFYGCSGLTSITIPNSVTSIGSVAFYKCYGLTSITFPNSVTSIGYDAFYQTAWYDNQPDGLIYAGKVAYKYKGTMPEGTEIVIKDGTLGFAESVFDKCSALTSVTIPNSVTSIGNYAFNGCTGLTSVTIPNSVTSIGDYAFNYCTGLTSVTIPESVTSIGESAFRDCSGLTSITIPNSVTSIGSSAFYNCSSLTSINIPNNVTDIGSSAFYGCSSLTSINISNNVTSIGSSAFYGCSGLTSITIPNSVTSIGYYAFQNCSGLTSVTIPNSVTSIGNYAFFGCSGLTKAEFASIESLCKIKFGIYDANPLYYSKHLYINGQEVKDVVIPNSVTSIGEYAFINCTGLTSVTIPNSVTSIGNYAFSNCSGLTSITIPNSVTSIGSSAFYNCSGLTKAEFASIESLCKINFGSSDANPLYYAKHLYINGQEITDLVIPESVTSIGSSAFRDCSGLTSITIPNSVTSIGSSAFTGCPLQTIVNHGSKAIGDGAFSDRVYLHTQLYVPEGTVWDYIFNTGWGEFHHIKEFASKADDIRNDAVYMIADRSGRNFPVFDKATKSLKNVAYTLNIDDNDTGACWQVKKNGSDTYLYNIGAGMYASYDLDNNLALSIAPSAVNIEVTEDGATINGRPVMLVANKSLTPEPTFILGDANGNGVVEIGDVTSVLTLMATPEATGYNNKAADANQNGEIEIGDVTTILTIMANGE